MQDAQNSYASEHAPIPAAAPFPGGLIALALIGLVGGMLGGWWIFDEIFSDSEQSFSVRGILERYAKESPAEIRMEFHSMLQSPEMIESAEDALKSMQKLLPKSDWFGWGNALLSIMGFIAAIGIFKRKDWGRKLEMAFIAFATVFLILAGFTFIPIAAAIAEILARQLSFGTNRPDYGEMLMTYWTVFSVVIALLHAGILYYLTRPSVRNVFIED